MEIAGRNSALIRKALCRLAAPAAFVGLGIAMANGTAIASADTTDASTSTTASHATSSTSPAKRTGRAPVKPAAPSAQGSVRAASSRIATAAPKAAVAAKAKATAPTAPASDPLAQAIAVIGHELEQTFASQVPTAEPSQIIQSTDGGGVVSGTFDAVDPGGNPLSFHVVTGPAHGVVDIATDGTWIYTPNPDVLEVNDDDVPLTDSFTVLVDNGRRSLFQIDDTGWHLNLFTRTGQTLETVTPTVNERLSRSLHPGPEPFQYDVVNLTSHALVLSGYGWGVPQPFNNPDVGTVIKPGGTLRFTNTSPGNVVGPGITPIFEMETPTGDPATSQNYSLLLRSADSSLWARIVPSSRCTARGGGVCTPARETYRVTEVLLMDAPGTVVAVPADQAQQQSDVLNALCGSFGSTCSFSPRGKPVQGFSAGRRVEGFRPQPNTLGQNVTTTWKGTVTDSIAMSWSASFTQKLLLFEKAIELGITETFGGGVTTTSSLSQTVSIVVPPGSTGFLFIATPVLRYYGDWRIKVGNTTWFLQNVWANLPDPSEEGVYVIAECKTGSKECADYYAGIPPAGVLPTPLPGVPGTRPPTTVEMETEGAAA